jgi:hypothetical protein
MAIKLKEKKTSITTVRDQFLSFATFPNPLVSHWSQNEGTCGELKVTAQGRSLEITLHFLSPSAKPNLNCSHDQDRPEGAGERHHMGHGRDAGAPRHPHGE